MRGGVQVRHVGPKLRVSRHLHFGHAPRAHLPRTVSHLAQPKENLRWSRGKVQTLFRLFFFIYVCVLIGPLSRTSNREVNKSKERQKSESIVRRNRKLRGRINAMKENRQSRDGFFFLFRMCSEKRCEKLSGGK